MKKIIKTKYIVVITIIIVAIIIIRLFAEIMITNQQMKNATKAVTINNNVTLYKKAIEKKKIKDLDIGTNVYILEQITDKKGNKWSKVKIDKKIGYILSNNIKSYKRSKMKKALMLDVSKFNMQNNFTTIGEFKAFILNNNISYIYIRAGGRGYGEAGNFYTDPNYKQYAEACEFLNIPFGFYFLDEAITSQEVDEEVSFINDFIQNNKYSYSTLPIAIDVEKHAEKGRADAVWNTRYILLNELIEKLQQKGYSSIIYSNANIANKCLNNVNTKLWLSYYPTISEIPKYWYSSTSAEGASNNLLISKMVAWQFTQTGIKNVINEKVDLSIVYNSFFYNGSMNDINNDITGKSKIVRNIFKLKDKKQYTNIFNLADNNI